MRTSTRIYPTLLTIRRIADLTDQPTSTIQRIVDETPGIRPRAVADGIDVYDRDALLSILSILDQQAAEVSA